MGSEFVISEKTMTITPLRSRTEALHKIPTPRTAKQCKSFCGFVNYLSLFYPDLQVLWRTIEELTQKDRPFVWGKEQEAAFNEVKKRLANPPSTASTKSRWEIHILLLYIQGGHQ